MMKMIIIITVKVIKDMFTVYNRKKIIIAFWNAKFTERLLYKCFMLFTAYYCPLPSSSQLTQREVLVSWHCIVAWHLCDRMIRFPFYLYTLQLPGIKKSATSKISFFSSFISDERFVSEDWMAKMIRYDGMMIIHLLTKFHCISSKKLRQLGIVWRKMIPSQQDRG